MDQSALAFPTRIKPHQIMTLTKVEQEDSVVFVVTRLTLPATSCPSPHGVRDPSRVSGPAIHPWPSE